MTTTKFTVKSNELGKKNGASLLTNNRGKDNMLRQCNLFIIWPLILLITFKLLAVCFAQTAPSVSVGANRVSLNEILKHQQALVEECLRLEQEKTFELRQRLLEAEQDDGQQHEPITLKLPAVCLLLNGPPTLKTPTAQSDPTPKSADKTHPLRLDLVNWLYDYDDLLDEFHHVGDKANNKTKRQIAGAAKSSKKGPKIYMADNEIDSPEQREAEQIFQSQLQQMIADDRFQQALHLNQDKIGAHLSPVILVPGLAGSRLQARVSKVNRVNIICKKQHDWQEMWLSLRSFLPIAIDCWIDNVRLEFDPVTGFAREPAGVETRAPSFGSVDSVRHLDLKSPSLTKYFDAIIENYLKIGYQVDRNLFAAPYDFRLAPQQIEESFFKPLKQLIDEVATGESNSNSEDLLATTNRLEQTPSRKVTLVCHSMGCTHLLVFLRQQSSSWRQKRVRKVVALSSPWGGAAKALKALVVGEQFGLPLVGDQKMRELVRTFPSVAYLLPQAEVFSRPSGRQADFGGPVLVQTPKQNYRVGQIEQLLREIGLDQHWKWFTETTSLIKPLEPLDDVQMDCLHGSNVDTPETIIFRNQTDFPDGDYELVNGDGDGTVNDQSLLVCSEWARRLPHMIRHRVVPNTSHSGLLTDKQVLEYLIEDAATN